MSQDAQRLGLAFASFSSNEFNTGIEGSASGCGGEEEYCFTTRPVQWPNAQENLSVFEYRVDQA